MFPWNQEAMKARLIAFGEIEVDAERYDYDVVIDGGKVRKRKKAPSKQYREVTGHTPLSIKEEIPWGGSQLIVGTGAVRPVAGHAGDSRGGGTARRQTRRRADQGGLPAVAGSKTQGRVCDPSHDLLRAILVNFRTECCCRVSPAGLRVPPRLGLKNGWLGRVMRGPLRGPPRSRWGGHESSRQVRRRLPRA